MGIRSVLDLKRTDQKAIRQQFSVVLERTVAELNGHPCLELEAIAPAKKQIMSSRSFGIAVTALEDLNQAVVAYTPPAPVKSCAARAPLAGAIQVYHSHQSLQNLMIQQYSRGITMALRDPSNDTRLLAKLAVTGLRRIYRPGFEYQKAGILLDDLCPAGVRQTILFDDAASETKSFQLMSTLDQVNRRMGRGTLRLLGEGFEKHWKTKVCRLTPRYTTRIKELAVARAE